MGTRRGAAGHIAEAVCQLMNVPDLPVRLRCWDGSQAGPPDAPGLVIHSRRALRRLLWSPNEVGLARAYVSGEIDAEGDLSALLGLRLPEAVQRRGRLRPREYATLLTLALRLGVLGPNPAPPPEEVRPLAGARHSPGRDRQAISHHYDVGNDFYRLVLGPTMTYSCGLWAGPEAGLDAAQTAKHDLIARKLGLAPGMRLLDVGCGWGEMALHAASTYGVSAVGITLSREQATLARKRVAEAGLADRVEIRVQDYREVSDGPYDAISSIGMAEHVGRSAMGEYTRKMHDLLRQGGRLLNHAIARIEPRANPSADTFISRYIFPDGELLTIGQMVSVLEEAGFEIRDVEALREHYGLTLGAWMTRLESAWGQAVDLTSEGRARAWLLYLAGSAVAFETGRIGVNQVLAVPRAPSGRSGMPLLRRRWLS